MNVYVCFTDHPSVILLFCQSGKSLGLSRLFTTAMILLESVKFGGLSCKDLERATF